jgi:hypothetical protein
LHVNRCRLQNDVPQPFSLKWDRLVHAPPHLLFDHLELCPHAVAPGFPLKLEFALASLAADEGEAQEVEIQPALPDTVNSLYSLDSIAPRLSMTKSVVTRRSDRSRRKAGSRDDMPPHASTGNPK